ncbi:hypothetical protein BK128_09770 [Viridibacillus sp. FSL H7-0596]|uniref:hypothetical protein n=1 Tax=Viridibacillus sp. FSL H7-0596 TaxID=1928923 RepID=UPI00096CB968|nr:hypothetical protein [Viridibacillus sp. FSL H7-0596]OMC86942.1 hypothetical protein BK128_09770 [Viridibacillus sp. FSL H7-0596]
MLAPVDKKFRAVIIYLYGREIDIETNIDIMAAEENGEMYVDLEDGRRIDLTNIERIITTVN